MADEARAKRAAAIEEKKRRLEQLKARRTERAAAASSTTSSSAGGNLDEYIDGLLKSDAPAVPGVEAAAADAGGSAPPSPVEEAPGAAAAAVADAVAEENGDAVAAAAPAAAAPAPAPAAPPARKVETFTMSTQTEEDDFPPSLSDEEDEDEAKKAKKEQEAAAAAEKDEEKAAADASAQAQLGAPRKLDPERVNEAISSRQFGAFLNSASKKVERVLGAPALAGLLDDPAYDDEDFDEDELGAVAAADGEGGADRVGVGGGGGKRAKLRAGRRAGAAATDGGLAGSAAGIVKVSQTYDCPRWTATRDVTSLIWSPHRRELLAASYHAPASSTVAVDAAVRSVSPADTPSSSLVPRSNELQSDGLALIWNLAMPDRPEHIFTCGSPVLCTSFHPTEPRLVVGGCHSGQVVVWDIRAGRLPVQRSSGPAGAGPTSTAAGAGGSKGGAGGGGGGGARGHAHPVCSMEVLEGGSGLVTAATDGRLNFWSLSNLRDPAESVLVKGANVSCLAVAPESNALLCGDEAGSLHAVVSPSETKAASQGSSSSGAATATTSSSSSRRTVRTFASGEDGHFGMVTGLSTKGPPKNGGHLSRGFLRGAPGLVLTCGVDWTTKLWAPAYADEPVLTFLSHSYDYMCDVQWSPSHPAVFATASSSGSLGLWNLASSLDEPVGGSGGIEIDGGGESSSSAGPGMRGLNKIGWSPDGRSLAAATADRLHVLGLSEDVARPKGDEEARMMSNLKSRGFLNEE